VVSRIRTRDCDSANLQCHTVNYFDTIESGDHVIMKVRQGVKNAFVTCMSKLHDIFVDFISLAASHGDSRLERKMSKTPPPLTISPIYLVTIRGSAPGVCIFHTTCTSFMYGEFSKKIRFSVKLELCFRAPLRFCCVTK
jgi:hypothetical protein